MDPILEVEGSSLRNCGKITIDLKFRSWLENQDYTCLMDTTMSCCVEMVDRIFFRRRQSVSLVFTASIVAHVSPKFGVNEEELKGHLRNRKLSDARALISWLGRRLRSGSITDMAHYFQRESSKFRRQIGTVDAKTRGSELLRKRLNKYINALKHT